MNNNSSNTSSGSGKSATGTILTILAALVAAVVSLFAANPLASKIAAVSNFVQGTALINNGSLLGISNFHTGTLIVAVVLFVILLAVIMLLKVALGGTSSGGSVGTSALPTRSVDKHDRPNIKRKR